MGPASNTSSRHIGKVDIYVKFEPKKMVMKEENKEHGRNFFIQIRLFLIKMKLVLIKIRLFLIKMSIKVYLI